MADALPAHSHLGGSSAERWFRHPEFSLEISLDGRVRYLMGKELKARTDKDGYMLVDFGPRGGRKTARVHRLVAACFFGKDDREVDHSDRCRSNNGPFNLGYSSVSANRRNVGVRRHSKSGVRNVRWVEKTQNWQAYCRREGKFTHLAMCASLEEARQVAEAHYG